MKFAVTTYSFAQLSRKKLITQFECIAKAKELGFDGIEIFDIPQEILDAGELMEYAEKVKAEAKRVGIELANFASSADFTTCADINEEIARVKRIVDFCAAAGFKRMRHDTMFNLGKFKSFDDALPFIADCCREITEYAQKKGIVTMVENHGHIAQDSIRMEKLYNAVNHENFKLLVDIGNFTCIDEDPVTAVGRVKNYAGYVHVKDILLKDGNGADPGRGFGKTRGDNYIRGIVIGHGDVPVKQCLGVLKGAGYDDYVTIEYEGMAPCLEALEISLENVKRYAGE